MTKSDETSEAATLGTRLSGYVAESAPLWVGALVAILVFLFTVQLLGTATEAAEPVIKRILTMVVIGDSSALGLSWLTTYVLTTGSVVAALALSLLRSSIVSTSEAFLMVAGSRLGAGAIVVLVGTFDYLHKRHSRSLSEGVSLGLLTFLVTATIYVPAIVLGLVVLSTFRSELFIATRGFSLPVRSLQLFKPIADTVTWALGPGLALVLALALLFGSLKLFDKVLERVETEKVRTYVFRHFERRWMAFGIGFLITAVTTSVAFSLGVIVPLYNREFVQREEIVPYILGANIGTLFDTLVVAVVLETTIGAAIVLLLMALGTLLTLSVLLGYQPYTEIVDAAQDRLLTDRRFLVGFAVLLVAAPLALLLVPHL